MNALFLRQGGLRGSKALQRMLTQGTPRAQPCAALPEWLVFDASRRRNQAHSDSIGIVMVKDVDRMDINGETTDYRFVNPVELPALTASDLQRRGAGTGAYFESDPAIRLLDRYGAS